MKDAGLKVLRGSVRTGRDGNTSVTMRGGKVPMMEQDFGNINIDRFFTDTGIALE